MSDYGLRIRDSSGNTILSATERITRLRYATIVAAGGNGSALLNDLTGISSIEITVPVNCSWSSSPHVVSREGNTITWEALSDPNGIFPTGASAIFVFLYT